MRRRTNGAKGLSFFSLRAVRKGFTLVELLIAMLITGLVAGSVITVFYVFIFHFEQTDELTTAQQNGEMVLTILRNPVLHAGLGMPSSDDFFDSFGGASADIVSDFPDGPITIKNSGEELWVLYGVPSSSIATTSPDLTSTSLSVTLDSAVGDTVEAGSGSKTKNWILFPTAGVPLRVKTITGSQLDLEIQETGDSSIALYDALYVLRGLKAFVDSDGDFKTHDLTLQLGASPRVENIAAVYFEHTDGLLKAYVAAAGPKRHDDARYANWAAFTEAFREWPGPEFTGFDDKWKYHRMRVLSESWRIRN